MLRKLNQMWSRLLTVPAAAPGREYRSRQVRPGVEGLESRWCPATTVGLVNGNTVTIRGDDAVNQVAIIQDDSVNTVTVLADGQAHVFTSSQVLQFDVDLKGGDDA